MRSALSDLGRALAASPSAGIDEWAAVVRVQLETLRVALGRHVANAEGEGGLFEEVIRDAPRLAHRVAKLREDHAALSVELTALAQRIDESVDDPIPVVRKAGGALLAHIAHHRYLASNLLYEADNVDIDAAD